jgi:hypothetical protein
VAAAGIAPAAPIYEVVLTIASVEPLLSDLFWVTLTSAVPGVSCARRSDDTDARSEYGEQRLSVEIVMWRSESPTG